MEHMCENEQNIPDGARLLIEPCENPHIRVDFSNYLGFDEAVDLIGEIKVPVIFCPWCGKRLREED